MGTKKIFKGAVSWTALHYSHVKETCYRKPWLVSNILAPVLHDYLIYIYSGYVWINFVINVTLHLKVVRIHLAIRKRLFGYHVYIYFFLNSTYSIVQPFNVLKIVRIEWENCSCFIGIMIIQKYFFLFLKIENLVQVLFLLRTLQLK